MDPNQVPNEDPPRFFNGNNTHNDIIHPPDDSDDHDDDDDDDVNDINDSSDASKTEFDSSKNFIEVNVHSGLWRTCVLQDEAGRINLDRCYFFKLFIHWMLIDH